MSRLTSEAILSYFPLDGPAAVWVGGSVGRQEMMPHSDVDLFLIEDSPARRLTAKSFEIGHLADLARRYGKFELGFLTLRDARRLIAESLVDANRLIDGYGLCGSYTPVIEAIINDGSTVDRQLSNLLTEYHYWHTFDFPSKSSKAGPNVKYSPGGSRVAILFNWRHRLVSREIPLTRGLSPEVYTALDACGASQDVVHALDVVTLVKDVATGLYFSGAKAARFASGDTLDKVYRLLRPRLKQQGLTSSRDLCELYHWGRSKLSSAVSVAYQGLLETEMPSTVLRDVSSSSPRDLLELFFHTDPDGSDPNPRALAALIAWTIVESGGSENELRVLWSAATSRCISDVWGVILAIACSCNVSDLLLREILSWLDAKEAGAYLAKVISRSPRANDATRNWARTSYTARERIYQVGS